MMALYKENNANPAGGCVPMVLQIPVFIVLYGTIRGLTHLNKAGHGDPLYISHSTRLYHDLILAGGHLNAFGINLADSVRTPGQSWPAKLPFIALILVAIALQYFQMKQLSGRNPAAAQANPQMQQMQKIFPLFFAIIYISIPAGVNIYFIVSSMFRIGQQEAMYRWDPHIQTSMHQLRARSSAQPARGTAPAKRGGFLAALRPPAALSAGSTNGTASSNGNGTGASPKSSPTTGSANGNGAKPRPARSGSGSSPASRSRASSGSGSQNTSSQPRSRDKRPRRPR
jgi:YidC/Oxa1 family membrane protein insertase